MCVCDFLFPFIRKTKSGLNDFKEKNPTLVFFFFNNNAYESSLLDMLSHGGTGG